MISQIDHLRVRHRNWLMGSHHNSPALTPMLGDQSLDEFDPFRIKPVQGFVQQPIGSALSEQPRKSRPLALACRKVANRDIH